MQQYYFVLKECTIFKGFSDEELTKALNCLRAYSKSYKKHQIIRHAETSVNEIGIVISGQIFITKSDYDGSRLILSEITKGGTFGESLAFSGAKNSPIEIVAAADSTIVFVPVTNLPSTFNEFYVRWTQNLIKLLADKIMLLQIKNDILSQKTTRDKLLLYFEYESKTAGSKAFKIHFSREELADFLCLNSSAMSRELGKMRDDGLLTFHKNRFSLKK